MPRSILLFTLLSVIQSHAAFALEKLSDSAVHNLVVSSHENKTRCTNFQNDVEALLGRTNSHSKFKNRPDFLKSIELLKSYPGPSRAYRELGQTILDGGVTWPQAGDAYGCVPLTFYKLSSAVGASANEFKLADADRKSLSTQLIQILHNEVSAPTSATTVVTAIKSAVIFGKTRLLNISDAAFFSLQATDEEAANSMKQVQRLLATQSDLIKTGEELRLLEPSRLRFATTLERLGSDVH